MKKLLITLSFLCFVKKGMAQSVGVGTTTPAASAMLDISSDSKGLLIPRMTAANLAGIASPADGLMVYQTDEPAGIYIAKAGAWSLLGAGSNWSLTGNAGMVDGTSFIGTTDNVPFNIRVNNEKAGRIDPLLNNAFWGFGAGYSNTTRESNTAIGSFNTANGSYALYSNTEGFSNTADGYYALYYNTTGINNTAIGYNAQTPNATASNQVRIGNTAITYAAVQVPWTTTSDKRWKSDIQNSNLGLNFINSLRPVSYYRNNDESKKVEYGFIAQELEAALHKAGIKNDGIISKDDAGMYGVRYNDLMAPMVKAIQEQQQIIDTQNQKFDHQNQTIEELKFLVNKLIKENSK